MPKMTCGLAEWPQGKVNKVIFDIPFLLVSFGGIFTVCIGVWINGTQNVVDVGEFFETAVAKPGANEFSFMLAVGEFDFRQILIVGQASHRPLDS